MPRGTMPQSPTEKPQAHPQTQALPPSRFWGPGVSFADPDDWDAAAASGDAEAGKANRKPPWILGRRGADYHEFAPGYHRWRLAYDLDAMSGGDDFSQLLVKGSVIRKPCRVCRAAEDQLVFRGKTKNMRLRGVRARTGVLEWLAGMRHAAGMDRRWQPRHQRRAVPIINSRPQRPPAL